MSTRFLLGCLIAVIALVAIALALLADGLWLAAIYRWL